MHAVKVQAAQALIVRQRADLLGHEEDSACWDRCAEAQRFWNIMKGALTGDVCAPSELSTKLLLLGMGCCRAPPSRARAR